MISEKYNVLAGNLSAASMAAGAGNIKHKKLQHWWIKRNSDFLIWYNISQDLSKYNLK